MRFYTDTVPVERNDIKTAWAISLSKFILKPAGSTKLINRIVSLSAAHFNANLKQDNNSHERKFVDAKHAAILLLQEFSDLTNVEIGKKLNYCDHTCVYAAQRRYQNNKIFRQSVDELKQKI